MESHGEVMRLPRILPIMDLAIEMGCALDKKKLVKQLREAGFRVSDKLYKRMFPAK